MPVPLGKGPPKGELRSAEKGKKGGRGSSKESEWRDWDSAVPRPSSKGAYGGPANGENRAQGKSAAMPYKNGRGERAAGRPSGAAS